MSVGLETHGISDCFLVVLAPLWTFLGLDLSITTSTGATSISTLDNPTTPFNGLHSLFLIDWLVSF